jgi:hypothetical protein
MRLPFRRGKAPPPPETSADLLPIRIFGEDAEIQGWVTPRDERMTDVLQRGEEISFLPDGAPDLPESWVTLAPDEMRLVVPPPHVSRPELRETRPLQDVSIRIGAYLIVGAARMRSGQEHDPFLRATQPFLPVTGATISREGMAPESAEVIIVNLRWTEEINAV